MHQLKAGTAVVTGAGSGIGRALALAFAREGMRLALADIDEAAARETLDDAGGGGIAMRVDVSREEDVRRFAESVGAVQVVCNNAGVSPLGAAWEMSARDWEWIMGVNLWGVIHGVRAFVPRLIAQNEGHLVNTASVAGLISPPGMAAYNVTKHAVVALSETLHHDLRERGSAVGVSVLCPAYVPTRIAEFRSGDKSPGTLAKEAMMKKAVAAGKLSADDVAAAVVKAVKENRFYILTHPKIKGAIRALMEDVIEEKAPRDPLRL